MGEDYASKIKEALIFPDLKHARVSPTESKIILPAEVHDADVLVTCVEPVWKD